jgi:hypothetical protein
MSTPHHHVQRSFVPSLVPVALLVLLAGSEVPALGQQATAESPERTPEVRTATPVAVARRAQAIASASKIILAMQEGPERAEWPYEGVYRVRGQIPIGYRVGGTAICATSLLFSPAYKTDHDIRDAVARAAAFIAASIEHPLMSPEYDGGYDVRGWGYTYGLDFLLKHRQLAGGDGTPARQFDDAIRFYIRAVEQTEIPGVGGWNYARPAGQLTAPPSPFMTAPTLLALYQAAADGFEVDLKGEIIERALKSLTLARLPSGAYVYAGAAGGRSRDGTPGAIGRMVAAETALYLGGRSSQAEVRGSIDAFFVHWNWLDQRRAQPGTHIPPYGVAPYYFYFAHLYAAQAIELLPAHERAEYRRRLEELLFSVRQEDGGWNDRIFPRSASFGTAVASMALMMPDLPPPARWAAPARPDPAENAGG